MGARVIQTNTVGRTRVPLITGMDVLSADGGRLVSTVWSFSFPQQLLAKKKQRETMSTRVCMNSGDNPPNTRLAVRCHANICGILGYGYILIIHLKMKHGALCISGPSSAVPTVCLFRDHRLLLYTISLKCQCVESWSVSLLGFVL